MRTIFGALIIGFGFLNFAGAQEEELKQGAVCGPLSFAGVTAGVNTENEVVRLLGPGLARSDMGDAGGRIYVDKSHAATLQVSFYTDSVAGDITLVAGIDGVSPSEIKKAESAYINPDVGFGNWHQLKLGASEDNVIDNLGQPNAKTETGGWEYVSSCSCDIEDTLTLFFKNGHVSKVVWSAPNG